AAGHHVFARRSHLADDEHTLALVLLDLDTDLRVSEVALRQHRPEPLLKHRDGHASRRDTANEREGDEAVGVDAILARQVRFIEDRDRQKIVRPDRVPRRRRLDGWRIRLRRRWFLRGDNGWWI